MIVRAQVADRAKTEAVAVLVMRQLDLLLVPPVAVVDQPTMPTVERFAYPGQGLTAETRRVVLAHVGRIAAVDHVNDRGDIVVVDLALEEFDQLFDLRVACFSCHFESLSSVEEGMRALVAGESGELRRKFGADDQGLVAAQYERQCRAVADVVMSAGPMVDAVLADR